MNVSEIDDVAREAMIYLYTRPVERYGGILSSITPSSPAPNNYLVSSPSQNDLASCIQHWIFVVKFDDKTLYVEADENNGLLIPSVTNTEPENITLKKFLGKTKVSPAYVVKKAMQNSYNMSKYDLAFQNCQNWFVEIYQNLGLDCEQCPVPVENYISGASSLANALSVGLTAASTASSFGLGRLGSLLSFGAASAAMVSTQNPSSNPAFRSLSSKDR